MAWHAKLGASATKQWLNCPGSLAYVHHFDIPGSVAGMAAQEGTAAHLLIETCLSEDKEPSEFLGRLIDVTSSDSFILAEGAERPRSRDRVVFEVDDDMVAATTCMTDYVRRRLDQLGLTKSALRLETRVHPLPGVYQDYTGGSTDVVIDYWPEGIEIVDYKHGRGVFVAVEDNYQAQSYMLGCIRNSQDKNDPEYIRSYSEYRYTICQPRHTESPPGGISSEAKTIDELMDFAERLKKGGDRYLEARKVLHGHSQETALEALDTSGYLNPGPSGEACTFCPIKTCPAAGRRVYELTASDFVAADMDNSATLTMVLNRPDTILKRPAEGYADVLNWLPFLEGWIKGVREEAEAAILDGAKVPGYKVVYKNGSRSWRDDLTEEDILKVLTKKYKLKKVHLYNPPKMKTGVQIEKELIAKEQKVEFNEDLLRAPEPKKVVVPESDKRQAVAVQPGEGFDAPV